MQIVKPCKYKVKFDKSKKSVPGYFDKFKFNKHF